MDAYPLRAMGKYVLVVALASAIYGVASGSGHFIWFGLLLALFAVGSGFVLSLEDTVGHRRLSAMVLGWLQLAAIACGVVGLVLASSQVVVYGVVALAVVIGASFVISLRDARQRQRG